MGSMGNEEGKLGEMRVEEVRKVTENEMREGGGN